MELLVMVKVFFQNLHNRSFIATEPTRSALPLSGPCYHTALPALHALRPDSQTHILVAAAASTAWALGW